MSDYGFEHDEEEETEDEFCETCAEPVEECECDDEDLDDEDEDEDGEAH